MQFTDAPKMSIYRKKNATDADEVLCWILVPLKLRRTDIIIIQMPRPKQPHIIGFRRPVRSTKRAGKKLPMTNMILINHQRISYRFLVRPTFSWRTVGTKYLYPS